MKMLKLLVIFCFVIWLSADSFGQPVSEEMEWPELLEFAKTGYPFNSRLPFITAELRSKVKSARKQWGVIKDSETSNEWAGIYLLQNIEIMSTVLHWSPTEGFVGLGTESCGGVISDISLGKVAFSFESLRLFPETNLPSQQQKQYRPIHLPVEFVPVKWGNAHYLVTKNELRAFCQNYVAGFGNFKNIYVRPFIKAGDENEDELSKPILPKKYGHLAIKPLVSTVKSLGGSYLIKPTKLHRAELNTEVVLNVGKKSGVRKGMRFILFDLADDIDFYRDLEIISVTQNSCTGVFSRLLQDGDTPNLRNLKRLKKDYFQTVKVGMRACLRPGADVGTAYPYVKKINSN